MKVTDRLKTPKEKVKQEKSRLEKLEEDQLARMELTCGSADGQNFANPDELDMKLDLHSIQSRRTSEGQYCERSLQLWLLMQ